MTKRRIPKVLHYCFGLAPDFGGKPWSLVHYVCVKSAIRNIRPDEVRFYYQYEPSGPWWDQTKPLLTLVPITAPKEIFGRPLLHPAHQADVVRLEKLITSGGIYLDADVFVHSDFDALLDHHAILGREGIGPLGGLANAVILAEPAAKFLTRWYEEYKRFRGKGRSEYWSEHSVQLPARLAAEHPDEITILPFTALYWPLWNNDHLEWIFDSTDDIPNNATLANHLWESAAWRYLEDLTPGDVRRINTNFHLWARPYLEGLPDDFGRSGSFRPAMKRLKRSLKKSSRKLRRSVLSALKRSDPIDGEDRGSVFEQIYQRGLWGRDRRQPSLFFSGVGSRGDAADSYAQNLAKTLADIRNELGHELTVVDIGCGDFEVGRALIRHVPDMRYIGCDIVEPLVDHLSALHQAEGISFKCLDIVAERPPVGDVCLVRQVFQHLPNADIAAALRNLDAFPVLIVSEGHPVQRYGVENPDKEIGSDVRFDWRRGIGRGVELSKPPFLVETEELFRLFVPPFEEIVTEKLVRSRFRSQT
jgi:hypothetical protein